MQNKHKSDMIILFLSGAKTFDISQAQSKIKWHGFCF